MAKRHCPCKHIRSCGYRSRACVMSGTHGGLDVVVLFRACLMSPLCTTVWNKSKLAITEAHRISLQSSYDVKCLNPVLQCLKEILRP